jgi:DnaJ-class molecular chaperone
VNAYTVLGLTEGATAEEIRRAYRALARRHHPDSSNGCHETFLRIQAAYLVLTRPEGCAAHQEDPERALQMTMEAERRRAQLSRRRSRLRKLYE